MNVLYVSGSIGLGHVTRDLAIAAELRRQRPGVKVSWLAGPPASTWLREAGEHVLPEASEYAEDTRDAEAVAREFRANLVRYLVKAWGDWLRNARVVARVLARYDFDAVVSEEAYEVDIMLALTPRRRRRCPVVGMFNFFGVDATTGDLRERSVAYAYNVVWVLTDRRLIDGRGNRCLFLGEHEDIPDRSLGPLLPARRSHASRYFDFLGYVLPFDPREFADRAALRAQLSYDDRPLIVAAVGGTAIGRDLLELCGRAFPLIRERLSDVRLILVCGPRIDPARLDVPDGVECRGFVPELYRHFAACDLAIVQAGGTSTLELTALQRPFLYFPLEGHFEQEITVAGRLARHGAGVRMTYSRTTAGLLAETVLAHLGEQPSYPPISTAGARRAATAILEVAGSGR